MKNDMTRDTFDPARQYARVLLQQGRVQLDADWNEQVSILLHYMQNLAADIIGPHGGPKDVVDAANNVLSTRCGFEIIVDEVRIDQLVELGTEERTRLKSVQKQTEPPILIGAGRYYVDGVSCENPHPLPYSAQPGLSLQAGQRYLVYLDVWERLLTYLDDDHIREVALNGADTATRSQITAQVRIRPSPLLDAAVTRDELRDNWDSRKAELLPARPGQLKVELRSADDNAPTGPCITSPEAGYRGIENQLYRVEIHRGGDISAVDNPPTFKWSRDNGSVVAQWLEQEIIREQEGAEQQGYHIKISDVHDQAHGFAEDQWAELSYDQLELQGRPGTLVKVSAVQGNTLTVYATTPDAIKDVPKLSDITSQHPKVRRWDQQDTGNQQLSDGAAPDGAVPVVEGQWIDLENGIRVWFTKSEVGFPNQYRSGDYWLIPARIATGDVEWPQTTDAQDKPVPKAIPPHGIAHHYAPLSIITVAADMSITAEDCRRTFDRLG